MARCHNFFSRDVKARAGTAIAGDYYCLPNFGNLSSVS
jgi:hypothetical protein